MPRTSNLGDLQGSSSLPARTATSSGTVNIAIDPPETRDGSTRYEQALSIAACVSLIACGIGVGIWASM